MKKVKKDKEPVKIVRNETRKKLCDARPTKKIPRKIKLLRPLFGLDNLYSILSGPGNENVFQPLRWKGRGSPWWPLRQLDRSGH